MSSQLIIADDRLATVFSHYYCVQQAADAPVLPQQLLPNYEMLLAFNFGPAILMGLGGSAFRVQRTAVLGPLQHLLRYELPPGADLIVVNFTLNGFYRLLGKPMREFRDTEWLGVDELVDVAAFNGLWHELIRLPARTERLEHISAYLLTHLKPIGEPAQALIDSIPLFSQTVVDPVKAMAVIRGVSARSVQLHLQINLGYSARELTRFLRFKQLLRYLIRETSHPVDWLALVDQFGYYDHSHLIRDFRYFLGMKPGQFVEQMRQGTICMSKSGQFY